MIIGKWSDYTEQSDQSVTVNPPHITKNFIICAHARALPVCTERRQREHGHADRGELDDGDEFTRRLAEHPLLGQVAERVHGHAGDEQQQVPGRQAGDEDVGHAAHGAVGDEDLHQGDVAHQTHGDDQDVHRGHDAAHGEVHRLLVVPGAGPPAGLLGGVGAQRLGVPGQRRGEAGQELVVHGSGAGGTDPRVDPLRAGTGERVRA